MFARTFISHLYLNRSTGSIHQSDVRFVPVSIVSVPINVHAVFAGTRRGSNDRCGFRSHSGSAAHSRCGNLRGSVRVRSVAVEVAGNDGTSRCAPATHESTSAASRTGAKSTWVIARRSDKVR